MTAQNQRPINKADAHLPPHSLEAEEAVLGSILIDPTALDQAGAHLSQPGDFYLVKHGWIWDTMHTLHKRRDPIDFLTVCEELDRRGQLADAGDQAYLSHLIGSVPTAIHAEGYARIVADTARRRRLIQAAGDIVQLAYAEDLDIDQVEADALRLLCTIQPGNGKMLTARHVAGEVLDMVSTWAENPLKPGQVRGLSTGFSAIDRTLGGMARDTLIILAGRPGMGKSALAFNIAENVARQGKHVAVFSLEMSRRKVVARLACGRARVNWLRVQQGLTDGQDLTRLMAAIGELGELPLAISDATDLTTAQVRAEVARLHAKKPLSLVVLDHIGLLADQDDNEVRRLGKITWALKRVAKDFGLPVLALAQLNRSVESRDNKRPKLGDLRESGKIEENADVVLMMYREKYYKPDAQDVVEIIARKNRDGETHANAHLRFVEEYARFYDVAEGE
ncbi:MAG: replicative DNA helicase [Thermoflexales bacterium]|nr:replicative DNA helicase [Thermoflexales bacterium]